MNVTLQNGEKIIRCAVATLRFPEHDKKDGQLCLSNLRLRFQGYSQEIWSYSLDEIIDVKIRKVFFIADGIVITFTNDHQAEISLYERQAWLADIVTAKVHYQVNLQRVNNNNSNTNFKRFIRQNMMQYFNPEEFKTLCFEMNIDYHIFEGVEYEAQVRELITYCERRDMLTQLQQHCQSLRPNVRWLK